MHVALVVVFGLLAGCAGVGEAARESAGPVEFGTLDGAAPMIVAHRGSAGTGPEETLDVYRAAVDAGVSVLELDLLATKDHELVARHDPNLALSTDVARREEFAHPFTFRSPADRLAADYHGDPKAEYRQFFALGVDGVFSDYAHTALEAFEEYTWERRGDPR